MRTARSLAPHLALFVLAACGGKPKPAEPTAPAATSSPATTPTPTSEPTATADAGATPEDTAAAPAPEDSAAAPAPADADLPTPEDTASAAPAADDFGALRKVPLTLQYLVNGRVVACEVTDAGVADTDLDIKVHCSPDVP